MRHRIRHRDGGTVDVELTRDRAIKALCTECTGWGEAHPRDCQDRECPLWPWRGRILVAIRGKGGREAAAPDEPPTAALEP